MSDPSRIAAILLSAAEKATPRPWKVQAQYLVKQDGVGVAVASSTQPWTTERSGPLFEEACANAALIVAAVNAHEPMLAALKECEAVLVRTRNGGLSRHAIEILNASELARAAIAKATETGR